MTTRGTETRSAKTACGLGPKDDGPVPSGTRPNTPVGDEREAIAEALALRFIERSKRRLGTPGNWARLADMPRSYSDDFYADADAILARLSPDRGQAEAWAFLPKQIGRLELGDRPSDSEATCSYSHTIRDGDPIYWPQGMGEFDDSDPYCLAHAIEQAESDSGWCQVCISRDLAADRGQAMSTPDDVGRAEALDDVVTHRRSWRDGLVLARDFACEGSEDPEADRLYWQHEIDAFDRTFAVLAGLSATPSTPGVREALEDCVALLEKIYPNPAPHGQINRARAALSALSKEEGL